MPESAIFECYFENPRTRFQPFCTHQISQIDGLFRDAIFSKKYPLNEAGVKLMADHRGTAEEIIRSRSSIIDLISTVLLPGKSFRLHRNATIRTALAQREDYLAALQRRKSQRPQVKRAKVASDPLGGLIKGLATGMAAILIIAHAEQSARASANAANSNWAGHEDDEWCYVEYDYYYDGSSPVLKNQMITYCTAYNGFLRNPSPIGDRCYGVEGWCPHR